MARWREYDFYYLLPDGKFHYGGQWQRNRSDLVSGEEISQATPKEALAIVYTEDIEYYGGYDSSRTAWVNWIDTDIENKLSGGKAIVDQFIQECS